MKRPSSNSSPSRRRLVLCSAAVGLLLAGSAGAAANVSQCRRMTRQIDHFENVAEMAKERGDRIWFEGTASHLQRLSDRHERMCPEEKPNYVLMMTKWFGKTARAAGKSVVKYLTFGAY